MIDTVNLLPPGFGPRANPLLFGVSEGLMHLFPLPVNEQTAGAGTEPSLDAGQDTAPEQAPSAIDA
jgi:hypothetical protein